MQHNSRCKIQIWAEHYDAICVHLSHQTVIWGLGGGGGELPLHKNDQFIIWKTNCVFDSLLDFFTQKHCFWSNTPSQRSVRCVNPWPQQCQVSANVKPPYILLTPPFAERVVLLLALPLSQVRNSSFIWNLPIQHSMNSAESNPWPNSMYQCQASVKVMPPLRSLKTALCWESYPGSPHWKPPLLPSLALASLLKLTSLTTTQFSKGIIQIAFWGQVR